MTIVTPDDYQQVLGGTQKARPINQGLLCPYAIGAPLVYDGGVGKSQIVAEIGTTNRAIAWGDSTGGPTPQYLQWDESSKTWSRIYDGNGSQSYTNARLSTADAVRIIIAGSAGGSTSIGYISRPGGTGNWRVNPPGLNFAQGFNDRFDVASINSFHGVYAQVLTNVLQVFQLVPSDILVGAPHSLPNPTATNVKIVEFSSVFLGGIYCVMEALPDNTNVMTAYTITLTGPTITKIGESTNIGEFGLRADITPLGNDLIGIINARDQLGGIARFTGKKWRVVKGPCHIATGGATYDGGICTLTSGQMALNEVSSLGANPDNIQTYSVSR